MKPKILCKLYHQVGKCLIISWLIVAAALIIVSVHSMNSDVSRAENPDTSLLLQNGVTPESFIVEQLSLSPGGFFPAEFKRIQGRFLLAVNNRAGITEMNLTLSREVVNTAPQILENVRIQRGQPDWNGVFDLQPGAYVLTVASNPKWICRITITPK